MFIFIFIHVHNIIFYSHLNLLIQTDNSFSERKTGHQQFDDQGAGEAALATVCSRCGKVAIWRIQRPDHARQLQYKVVGAKVRTALDFFAVFH